MINYLPKRSQKGFMEEGTHDSKNKQRFPRQKKRRKSVSINGKTFCRGAKLPAYGPLGKKQDLKEKWKVAVPQRKEEEEGSPHR